MCKNTELKVTAMNSVSYSLHEICPICGVYEPDGAVCTVCRANYGFVCSNQEIVELLNYTRKNDKV